MARVIAAFSQFFDDAGDPLENGWLKFLVSQTNNTDKDTYYDSDLTILNTNPVQLDAAGRCPDIFGTGAYRIVSYENNPVTNQPGTQVQVFDPVQVASEAESTTTGAAANGFVDTADSSISFVNATRTFSIQPTATNYTFYVGGTLFTRTGDTVQIADTEGVHVIYYDSNIVLTSLVNPTFGEIDTIIQHYAIVAILYWDTSAATQIFLADERHGYIMSPSTHAYLHFTEGMRYLYGLGLNTIDPDQSGDLDAHAQFGIDAGAVTDEDLFKSISAIVSTTGLPIYYMTGAAADWNKSTNAGFSVLTTGTGRLAWNEFTGGAWQLTEVDNNDFVLCHVFATNEVDNPMIAVLGQAEYNTLGQARTGAETEIRSLLLNDILFPEIKPIATVILQTSTGYANAVKGRIRTTDEGDNYIDWRNESIGRAEISTSDHGSLTGLGDNDHPQYLLLTGGTLGDNVSLYFGTDNDFRIFHDGTNAYLRNITGNINIQNQSVAGAIVFQTNSVNRWTINAAGNLYPNAAGAYDIGLASAEVQHIYQTDNGYHYFGSDQDAHIRHSGSSMFIQTDVGNLDIRNYDAAGYIQFVTNSTYRWQITPDGDLVPSAAISYDIGGVANEVKNIYQGSECYHYFGNSQSTYMIQWASGAFDIRNNSGAWMTLGTTDAYPLAFFTENTERWQIQSTGHLVPGADGVYNIGSSTVRIKNIFHGDGFHAYYGNNQDANIFHTGTGFAITNTVGDITINQQADSNAIYFQTGSTLVERWRITNGGTLQPGAGATYNIGGASKTIAHIYHGDNCKAYYGASQDAAIYHDGTNFRINTTTGGLYFMTNNSTRWVINDAGNVQPGTTDTYSLGTTLSRIKHIYQGDSCIHYLGDQQDYQMYHTGALVVLRNQNGSFYIDNKDASGNIYFRTGAGPSIRWLVTASGAIHPGLTNNYDIGSSSLRVRTIYSQNALNTSDERLKKGIEDSNLGLEFINMLRPVKYRLIEFENERTRHGLIAQEVEDARGALGLGELDENIVHYDKKSDRYDLNYQELIAPMIQAIKELSNKLEDLKCRTLQ
jgi:hypothetical protein